MGLDVDGPPLVGGQPPEYRGPLAQGELLDHIVHVGRVGLHDLGLQAGVGLGLLAGGGHAEHVDEESLLERAVLAHGAVVVVGRADGNDHGRQVGRVEGREGGLVAPGVGVAHRPHATGTPRLRAQPLDGVVAVGGFLREGVPLTLGLEAAADVLHSADVAATREIPGVEDGARGGLIVGCAHEDYRELAVGAASAGRGEVEVGGESDAVPGRDHDVVFGYYVVLLVRTLVVQGVLRCWVSGLCGETGAENRLVRGSIGGEAAHPLYRFNLPLVDKTGGETPSPQSSPVKGEEGSPPSTLSISQLGEEEDQLVPVIT